MKTFTQFWADERGFVVSSELVLIATIVVIGLVTGLTTVRDQVLMELGDNANAVKLVNQSYAYRGGSGHSSSVAGSAFRDGKDFCHGLTDNNPPTLGSGIDIGAVAVMGE